jgi:hypothetical protein
MKPNFLIIGAAKCGTTSMHRYLSQHPDIFMPGWKEPSFFIGDPFKPLNCATQAVYYKLFKRIKEEHAFGEASTAYLYDEAAPKLIHEALGNIKIIIMLRDPANMSYSLYNHQVRKEGETIESFEEALEAEEVRLKNSSFKKKCYGWHANYYYYRRALYYDQVKRYWDTFGQNNIFIILFEDLNADPIGIVQKTFEFLNVEETFIPIIQVHNAAGEILKIPEFWKDRSLLLQTTAFVFSKTVFKKIHQLLRNIGRKPPPAISPETAQKLKKRFYGDICRLETLTGKNLSAWKNL